MRSPSLIRTRSRNFARLGSAIAVLGFSFASATADDAPPAEAFAATAANFEAKLATDPDDFDARLGAARARNDELAIRTNANLPLIDGLQDSDANRALWADLGARALAHARIAQEQEPRSVEAASALAVAYMYYSSSLGIVSAILKGAGGEYQEHAQRVVALDPAFDDAIGHTLLAGFFLVAPWPIRDLAQARSHYERAAELAPDSARNQYGLGVYWARAGEPARARAHFERAESMPCSEHSERLICGWLKRESRRAAAALTP